MVDFVGLCKLECVSVSRKFSSTKTKVFLSRRKFLRQIEVLFGPGFFPEAGVMYASLNFFERASCTCTSAPLIFLRPLYMYTGSAHFPGPIVHVRRLRSFS